MENSTLPLAISLCSLGISLFTAFEHWNDKQPRLFISDTNVELFHHKTMEDTYVRFDLTLNALSSQPIPVSHASISMGTAQRYDCALHSPTPGILDGCTGHALDRNQKLNDFFGPSVRFPTTLPPSSAQHICLWLRLPNKSELLRNLEEALFSPMESEAVSSTGRIRRSRAACRDLDNELRALQKRDMSFFFRSGNCTLLASSQIDIRSSSALQD